ncbi:MAG: DUF4215 domain-containing protein, partial [Myxococcales bacterium]|nr:DUF4215 domain-containing protein [Myxococcales bacterium]
DGLVALGAETCDDGNLLTSDGCSGTCEVETGWTCDGPEGVAGHCDHVCGDGVVAVGAETCDDGGTATLDGCDDGCRVERGWTCFGPAGAAGHCAHVCGDGRLARGAEGCDDGNLRAGDGCSPACEPESGWVCGDGPFLGVIGALPDTFCTTVCGDGVVGAPRETCDDGNDVAGDGCGDRCRVEYGWTCAGAPGTSDHCGAVCGDGRLAVGAEVCDDGHLVGAAPPGPRGCSDDCEVVPGFHCGPADFDLVGRDSTCGASCGDGVVAVGVEACDDHNTRDGDGCSAVCAVEPGWDCGAGGVACVAVCGDGALASVEGCDDGNTVAGDGCSATCRVEVGFLCGPNAEGPPASACASTCGDGVRAADEGCDEGGDAGFPTTAGCAAGCEVADGWTCHELPSGRSVCAATRCGDGIVAGDEACDDGGNASGDGCSAGCADEVGFTCRDAHGDCDAICGDGLIVGGEACDEGPASSEPDAPPRGCAEDCGAVLHGFTCSGEPSVCVTRCGDNVVAGDEACDDGRAEQIAEGAEVRGCDGECRIVPGWSCDDGEPSYCLPGCGDGLVQGVEACDDGNLADDDGCSAGCTVEPGQVCEGEPSVCAADQDGDGILDDGDGSGIAGDHPCASFETVGCDDNCVADWNVGQVDSDGDGRGDACQGLYLGPRIVGG